MKNIKNTTRLLSYIVLFLGVFVMPWWLTCMFLFVSILFFDMYIEGVLVGVMMDVVYTGAHIPGFFGILFTTLAVAAILLKTFLKPFMRV